jgi:hypothetical protein
MQLYPRRVGHQSGIHALANHHFVVHHAQPQRPCEFVSHFPPGIGSRDDIYTALSIYLSTSIIVPLGFPLLVTSTKKPNFLIDDAIVQLIDHDRYSYIAIMIS